LRNGRCILTYVVTYPGNYKYVNVSELASAVLLSLISFPFLEVVDRAEIDRAFREVILCE